jgi:hypothetical protein
MAASYPTSVVDLVTNTAGTDVLTGHAAKHNSVGEEIEAIETELGIAPSAGWATVLARLDQNGQKVQTPSYASSYTPDVSLGSVVIMTLTGDISLVAPINPGSVGTVLTLILIQDGVGGHNVTFASEYKGTTGINLTLGATLCSQWLYDGTNWRGIGVNGSMNPTVVQNNGGSTATRRKVNFIPGSGIQYTFTDNAASQRTDLTITATSHTTALPFFVS